MHSDREREISRLKTLAERSVDRRAFLRTGGAVAAVGALSPLLAACGSSDEGGSGSSTGATASGSVAGATLNYMGGDSLDLMRGTPALRAWIAENRVKVNATFVPDDSTSIAKLAAGGNQGTNAIQWIDQFVHAWTGADLIEELDMDQLPNASNMIPGWGGEALAAFNRGPNGKPLGIPQAWYVLGIAYDSKKMAKPDSYMEFLDPKYKGKIAMLDQAGAVLSIGVQALGFRMDTLTKSQLEEVKELMVKFVKQTRVLAKTDGDLYTLFGSGEIDAAVGCDPATVPSSAKAGNKNIKMNIGPKEGGVSFCTLLGIPKGAKDTAVAYAFINEFLTEDVASIFSSEYGGLTPVRGTPRHLPDWYTRAIDVSDLDKLFAEAPMQVFPPAKAESPDAVTASEFLNAWNEVKVKAGQS